MGAHAVRHGQAGEGGRHLRDGGADLRQRVLPQAERGGGPGEAEEGEREGGEEGEGGEAQAPRLRERVERVERQRGRGGGGGRGREHQAGDDGHPLAGHRRGDGAHEDDRAERPGGAGERGGGPDLRVVHVRAGEAHAGPDAERVGHDERLPPGHGAERDGEEAGVPQGGRHAAHADLRAGGGGDEHHPRAVRAVHGREGA